MPETRKKAMDRSAAARRRGRWIGALVAMVLAAGALVGATGGSGTALAQAVAPLPEPALTGGPLPPGATVNNLPNTLGGNSDSDIWRQVRKGTRGQVTQPDPKIGVMIQSEGESWRLALKGPLTRYGWWTLAGVVAILALFFAARGRITIEAGRSGRLIERFTGFERFVHWLTAGSFVVLAITGLNLMYGRYFFALDPASDTGQFSVAHRVFAAISYYGKISHNFIGFAFMVGIVLMVVIWLRDNIPDRHDLVWLAKGGGLFSRHSHPPARKFNAGQKILFWIVILGGASSAVSGIALLFPYQLSLFGPTFEVLNLIGFDLPTNLAPLQEMQLSQLWHAVLAIALIAVIIGHIYIGSIGMEAAFDAMGTGQVDENWAREHHSVWVEERERQGGGPSSGGPSSGGPPGGGPPGGGKRDGGSGGDGATPSPQAAE